MRRIFFAGDMAHTPFQEGRRRQNLKLPPDIAVTETPGEADIFIGRFLYEVAEYFHLNRQFYLWTHEPSWCLTGGKAVLDQGSGREVHVSTAWNGDIYLNPLFYFPFSFDFNSYRDVAREKTEICSIFATYRKKSDRYQNNINVDLSDYRQKLAMGLQGKYDSCHIFGRSWPTSIVLQGESRGGAWRDTKLQALKPYAFNLCIENTIIENYVTEKIWDSLLASCVPIYYGTGSGIGSVLSERSYINSANFSSVDELFDHMRSMTVDERLRVIESAYDDIDGIMRTTSKREVEQAIIDVFVSRVRQM